MTTQRTRSIVRSRVAGKTLRDVLSVARDSRHESLSVPYLEACRGHVEEAFVFAILTTNEQTPRAERALAAWKDAGKPRNPFLIADVVRPHSPFGGALTGTLPKPNAIAEWLARYDADPTAWSPRPGESASTYRDRIFRYKVRGLGLTKTTWACQLAYGGGDIACLDRHMLRLLLGRPVTKKETDMSLAASRRLYRRLERLMVWIADRYRWHSASALQWAAWVTALGQPFTHEVVYA